MAQIKHIPTGNIYTVSQDPHFSGGVWECGDQRFTDPDGTQFQVVSLNPPPVPQSVTRFQALAALSNAGLLTAAQNAVAASTNPLVPLAWNNAQTFERSSQTLAALAAALNLTSAQVDSLFIAASTITA